MSNHSPDPGLTARLARLIGTAAGTGHDLGPIPEALTEEWLDQKEAELAGDSSSSPKTEDSSPQELEPPEEQEAPRKISLTRIAILLVLLLAIGAGGLFVAYKMMKDNPGEWTTEQIEEWTKKSQTGNLAGITLSNPEQVDDYEMWGLDWDHTTWEVENPPKGTSCQFDAYQHSGISCLWTKTHCSGTGTDIQSMHKEGECCANDSGLGRAMGRLEKASEAESASQLENRIAAARAEADLVDVDDLNEHCKDVLSYVVDEIEDLEELINPPEGTPQEPTLERPPPILPIEPSPDYLRPGREELVH